MGTREFFEVEGNVQKLLCGDGGTTQKFTKENGVVHSQFYSM